ncbi:MAG: Ig-like domain-containing protein [Pseudomonadota bacterium]
MPVSLIGDFDFTVIEGRTVPITSADLSSTGSISGANNIIFTIQDLPQAGQPFAAFAASPGERITAFTQADIDAGRVVFTHDGSEAPTSSLSVTVSDVEGATPPQALSFTVTPANDGPNASEEFFVIDPDAVVTVDLFASPPGDEGPTGTDPDGDAVSVVDVVHDAAGGPAVIPIGVQTELASGALVTFNADGTIDFDANGAYDAIIEPTEEVFEFTVDDGFADQTVDIGSALSIDSGSFTFTLDADTGLGRTDQGSGGGTQPISGIQLVITTGTTDFQIAVTAFDAGEAILLVPTPFELLNYAGGLTSVSPGIVSVEDTVTNGTLVIETEIFTDSGVRTVSLTVPDLNFEDNQDGIVEINAPILGSISSQATNRAVFEIDPVNDAPEIAVQAAPDTGQEDGAIVLTELLISDAEDSGGDEYVVELTVTNGIITIGDTGNFEVIGGANGTGSIEFSATLADINAGLADVVFTPDANFNGTAQLDISVDDQANGGTPNAAIGTQTRDILVQAVNDAPFIAADGVTQFVTLEDEAVTLNALFAGDPDIQRGDEGDLALTATTADGTVTFGDLTGLTVTGGANGTGAVTVQGDIGAINDALGGLSFLGDQDFFGSTDVTLTVNDLGTAGVPGPLTDTLVLGVDVLSVNDAPLIFTDQGDAFVGGDGQPILIEGFSVDDVDLPAQPGTLTVGLSVGAGTLTLADLNGLTIIEGANGQAAILFEGRPDDINNALAGLTYQGPVGQDQLSIFVTDPGSGDPQMPDQLTTEQTINISVDPLNTPPIILADDGTNFAGTEDQDVAITGLSVDDAEASSFGSDVEVVIGVEIGFVTVESFGGVQVDTPPQDPDGLRLTGRIDDVNAVLGTLLFFAGADVNGITSLVIEVSDLGASGFPGELIDTQTLTVDIAPVDDLPVVDDVSFITDEDTFVTDFLLGAGGQAFRDADGDLVTIVALDGQMIGNAPITLGSGAEVEIDANGRFVYNPNGAFDDLNAGDAATDMFLFTASDEQGNLVDGVAEFTVSGITDAPPMEVVGGSGTDRIAGGDGDDLLDAGGGNDFVSGGAGNDIILAGDGDDYGRGGRDNDTVSGGAGNDALFGDQGEDVLRGGAGNDRMFGLADNDILRGGGGNDTVAGSGGNDAVFGGNGDDKVRGGRGEDILSGGTGNDRLAGGRDNDALVGDDGDDRLRGGMGADDLSGGIGNDVLIGGGGNDVLLGNAGNDVLTGGRGADLFAFLSGDGNDRITDFNQGEDLMVVDGSTFGQLTFEEAPDGTLMTYDGGTVLIEGIAPEDITEQDFLIEPPFIDTDITP